MTDESLRFATIVGLVTVPFTVILSGGSEPHVIAGTPVLLGGLIVGYVYSKRPVESRRAGIQTGFAASIGVVVWQLSYMASLIWTESFEIAVVLAASAPLVAVIGIGLSVLVGTVGAMGSDWLAKKGSRVRPVGTGN